MRTLQRLLLTLMLAMAPAPLLAQADAPAAAPVPEVTTAAVPTAAPQLTAPTTGIGMPVDRGINLQEPMTGIAVEAHKMANGVLNPIMAFVALFVLVLLAYTILRYRAGANPVASKTSHNTMVEVIWTVVPVLILVWIAVPSFRLLANQYSPPKADITIKAIGHQWYWEYEYPDQGGFTFDAVMLTKDEAAKRGSPDLLDTDNRLVVPAGATVKVLTTAADVIHSFAVPSFWVKMDAVPGRVNETWFKVDRPGVYFGQCSELCGTKHAFMPIAVEVLPKDKFDAWVAAKQAENGITPAEVQTAAADAAATPVAGGPGAPAPAAAPAAAAPAAETTPAA